MTARRPPSVDANRLACGCMSPQPGASTPSTHHGWGSALGLGKFLWWKEKMAMLRCINCATFCVWEGNDGGLTSQYGQRLPSEYAGPFGTPLMGMSLLDLGQFNDWNEKIEWLSMQKYVTTGGKELLASTWPMRIFTPRWGTWRCLTCLVLFKFDRWVYYKLSSSGSVLFHNATADVIPMIRQWFDNYYSNRVHSGSWYSLDDRFGHWIGSKRCIAYNAQARTTHALLVHFYCWAEMMQYTQMNSYVNKLTMQIVDYRQ
jgi:hypothetical protein